jgi:leader peptidase (prepilin peptidase)/N-methyltransferase
MSFLLFLFGAAIGSFLNVVALRYDPDRFLFGRALSGRSHCPHCGTTLRWFELIPVLSFFFQAGRCRTCRARLSFRYPAVEILCGLLFVFVPLRMADPYFFLYLQHEFYLISSLWVLVFLLLLLMALIDLRFSIIPDEINVALLALGGAITYASRPAFGMASGSFLGAYGFLFGFRDNIWTNHIVFGALAAGLFFLGLIFITRGRGMGVGDLKLVIPLGLLFGWPDILFVVGFAFILGSLVGAYAIFTGRKTLKHYVPFGPFLAVGGALVFFFGYQLVHWYLGLFGL